MSSEWRRVKLKDVTSILGDGLHGTPAYDPDGDYFFINGNNLSNGRIVINEATKRVAHSEYAKYKKELNDRTILVSINGTLGNIAFYEGEKVVLGKSACYFNVTQDIDKFFVRYVLASPVFQDYIHNLATGSTIKNVSLRLMRDFEFPLPPTDLQRQISDVLRSLDDRITLLRETNATLEAIAQALFKSWFVDFDPVRAKMEGRTPEGMDEATAALFPDGFETSELGEVPRGWRVGSVYDISKVIYGAPFASKLFKAAPPGRPLVRIRDLKDERPGVFTEEVHPKGYLLKPGDIAVGMDGEFRAYIWGGETAWLNQRVCVFHPIHGACSAFVRLSIAPLLAAVEASETATTVIHLGKNDIDRFRVILPSSTVLHAFAAAAESVYERLVLNKQKAQTLSTLRDTLLPRLISGQLRLTEVVDAN